MRWLPVPTEPAAQQQSDPYLIVDLDAGGNVPLGDGQHQKICDFFERLDVY